MPSPFGFYIVAISALHQEPQPFGQALLDIQVGATEAEVGKAQLKCPLPSSTPLRSPTQAAVLLRNSVQQPQGAKPTRLKQGLGIESELYATSESKAP
jgi:hypothetical protein